MIRALLLVVVLLLVAACDAGTAPAVTSTVTVTAHPRTPIDL